MEWKMSKKSYEKLNFDNKLRLTEKQKKKIPAQCTICIEKKKRLKNLRNQKKEQSWLQKSKDIRPIKRYQFPIKNANANRLFGHVWF